MNIFERFFNAQRKHFDQGGRFEKLWPLFESMLCISISRFYRDRAVYDLLRTTLLPELAREASSRPKSTNSVW